MQPIIDPYISADGFPQLHNSVVVVADILGFKEQTKRAFDEGSGETFLQSLFSILSYEYTQLIAGGRSKWRLKVYSDNLMLGYPFLADKSGTFEFSQACVSIARYQLGMATRGYFIRGGISVGQVHISDLLVFGELMTEISKADRHGMPPGVMLLQSAVQLLREIKTPDFLGTVLSLDSITPHINYLGILELGPDSTSTTKMLTDHKTIIEQQLRQLRASSNCADLLSKFDWLAEYHNRFCATSNRYNKRELFVQA